MTHREFCYWLQGFFEVMQPKTLTKEQVSAIKSKLDETFGEDKTKAVMPKPDPGKKVYRDRKSAYDLRSSLGALEKMTRTYC